MPLQKVVRLRDMSDHGGVMITATGDFEIDEREGCVHGDLHQCPIKGHGTTPVSSSSITSADGKGILRVTDVAGCGARLITGSENVESE